MNRPAPACAPRARPHAAAAGFTLVEAAISLVLLALGSAVILTVLQQTLIQRKMAETDAVLAKSSDALLAYVTAYGRLPCPAVAGSNGAEAIKSTAGNVTTCVSETGFLPGVTLGMSNLDAWGLVEGAWHDAAGVSTGTYLRAIRYSVASLAGTPLAGALTSVALGAPSSPTQRAAVQAQFNANQGLFVCHSSAGILPNNNRCGPQASNTLSSSAAVIIWSLGNDAPYLNEYSVDEQQNENPTVPRVVISHTFTPQRAAGGPFDDQVAWIPYAAIADRLVYAGYVQ